MDLSTAAAALRDGSLVVYPTETVYGLGANALDPEAAARVFEVKGRSRAKPLSIAVPSVDAATEYAAPTARERAFMREFLPGPVTVIVERDECVPDVVTAGKDRVGVRIPDHDLALALLDAFAPITATSANVSGTANARTAADVDETVREAAAVVLDGGETPGGESTVVDVSAGEIIRHGALTDEIEKWLANR
jgi:L-threonylcarbamoyladenylate synthase